MKLAIGIPTFDRRDVLRAASGALNRAPWLDDVNIRVYDDASSLSVGELAGLFPTACEIVKRQENLGADNNTRQIVVDFLKTSDDVLFLLDSDLLVSEKAYDIIARAMAHSDGMLSLYNSVRHPANDAVRCGGVACVTKPHIGSAGAVLTRDLAHEIIANTPSDPSFDWRFCRYVVSTGRRILVTENSYVQHIGFQGTNCSEAVIDFGLSFDCDDMATRAALSANVELGLVNAIRRLQRYDRELVLNLRSLGRILERSVRQPIKRSLRFFSLNRRDSDCRAA